MKIESIAEEFLEISSEQRLKILFILKDEKLTLSNLAKKLEATTPEVHRNLNRLTKAGLIIKNSDSNYELTIYGKTICDLLPSFTFVSDNKKYFETHDFGNLPVKFIQRLGGLQEGKLIKGFVKVLEKWKKYMQTQKITSTIF